MLEDEHVSCVLAALANHNDVLSCPLTIFSFLCLDPSQFPSSILGVWCNQLSVFCWGITGVCSLHTLEITLAPNTVHTDITFPKDRCRILLLISRTVTLLLHLFFRFVLCAGGYFDSRASCAQVFHTALWLSLWWTVRAVWLGDADRKYPAQLHLYHIELHSL